LVSEKVGLVWDRQHRIDQPTDHQQRHTHLPGYSQKAAQMLGNVINRKGRSQGQQNPGLKIEFKYRIHANTKVVAQVDKLYRQRQRQAHQDQDKHELLRPGNTTGDRRPETSRQFQRWPTCCPYRFLR
jgi:hypothetical protein